MKNPRYLSSTDDDLSWGWTIAAVVTVVVALGLTMAWLA
jgi:hypothetical protein